MALTIANIVPTLAIHDGCCVAASGEWSNAEWDEARDTLVAALRAGWAALSEVGSALKAVVTLDNAPSFNAGHGAALTEDATHQLEASMMERRLGRGRWRPARA